MPGQEQLSVSDRSFQYGDGIFSTIRVKNGQLQFWPFHWQRLQSSMQRLGFAPLDEAEVKTAAKAQISQSEQVVKILVSRGHGGRGYSALGFDKDGRAYLYYPLIAEQDYKLEQSRSFVERIFAGRVAPLVAGFASQNKLNADDVEQLKQLIADWEQKHD